MRDDTRESSSVNIETFRDNAEVLASDEAQELDPQLSEQESDTADTNESTPLPTPPEDNPTPHNTPLP
ncbi:Hypothetical predicted protein [Paramuricea clavata]|uniref:Uncharacterized protein n=1 Tax=Paramuricea clavata TaxID=317549 RepID=A0A6S7KDR0_PARCT|nr:Hypothetical predicted protein [Paramuricea clavata]